MSQFNMVKAVKKENTAEIKTWNEMKDDARKRNVYILAQEISRFDELWQAIEEADNAKDLHIQKVVEGMLGKYVRIVDPL